MGPAKMSSASRDPYGKCLERCNHDLANGVTTDELLNRDGPHESRFEFIELLPSEFRHPLARGNRPEPGSIPLGRERIPQFIRGTTIGAAVVDLANVKRQSVA